MYACVRNQQANTGFFINNKEVYSTFLQLIQVNIYAIFANPTHQFECDDSEK